ncbi:MAG: SDR family oxidoreductase [Flavobacteriaceae bacterium]|nr:SDR family oxidoreductase [Flavobacteriaceae bacterium]
MNLSLKGKRAVVCGSSQGIGKAIAIALSFQGASITLVSRNELKLKKVLNKLDSGNDQKHNYVVADFIDDQSVNEIFLKFLKKGNKIDILINNTGGPPPGRIINARVEDFEKYMKMHLNCSHLLTKLFLPNMKKRKFGRIINVISISVKAPIDNLGVSNTVRWAMASWSKTLSNEVAKYGITVNNILPGFTMTDRLKNLIQENSKNQNKSIDEIEKNYKALIPSERFALPEEIASSVSFLCSNEASYINGINLPIDGGYSSSL